MSSEPYPIPTQETQIELIVVNSRFIATAMLADTVVSARESLARIRAAMPDANHHVYAYRVGYGNSVIEGMSDDGEPTGTAGPPALAVLRGADIGDTLVVVTRYFGGTKLGTGGLVRAYSDATRQVLEALPRQLKIPRQQIGIEFAYSFYERMKLLIAEYDGTIDDETFGQDASLIITLPQANVEAFSARITDMTAGRVEIIHF
ncbi:MAG: YigZ family protein [Anaerolineaceae bacterium]|nr:YigZ family protein [Anaerolineaceae bacterium]